MSAKDYLVQNMVSELVGYLMKDFGWDIQSAMRAVYHSALFQKLDDAEIELYVQSPLYVYSYLKKEVVTGKYV